MNVFARPESTRLLQQSDIAHLGISTKNGPHVTPELFSWMGGRLWFATARRTLKARLLTAGDRVGVLLAHGAHRLVIVGEARPLDGVRPMTFVASPPEWALYPAGVASFVIRNAPHLAGFIAQGPSAFPRSLSTFRMFIAVRPVAAVLLQDDRVIASDGPWAQTIEASSEDVDFGPFLSPVESGEEGAILDEFVGDAVVALDSATGPVVLPARWDPDEGAALVGGELLDLVGAREGDVAIEVDRTVGYAMEDKRGALLRGEVKIVRNGRVSRLEIDPERLTTWRGMKTETVPT